MMRFRQFHIARLYKLCCMRQHLHRIHFHMQYRRLQATQSMFYQLVANMFLIAKQSSMIVNTRIQWSNENYDMLFVPFTMLYVVAPSELNYCMQLTACRLMRESVIAQASAMSPPKATIYNLSSVRIDCDVNPYCCDCGASGVYAYTESTDWSSAIGSIWLMI